MARQDYIVWKFTQLGLLSCRFAVAKSAGKEDQAFNLWKRFEDCAAECQRLDPDQYEQYLKGYPQLVEKEDEATILGEEILVTAKPRQVEMLESA